MRSSTALWSQAGRSDNCGFVSFISWDIGDASHHPPSSVCLHVTYIIIKKIYAWLLSLQGCFLADKLSSDGNNVLYFTSILHNESILIYIIQKCTRSIHKLKIIPFHTGFNFEHF